MSSSPTGNNVNNPPAIDAPPVPPAEVNGADQPPAAAAEPTKATAASSVKSILINLLAGITLLGLFAASLALFATGSMLVGFFFLIGSATVALLAMFLLNSGATNATGQKEPAQKS